MSFGLGFGFPRNRPFAGGPSLNFQFAGSTTLDPQITFTRASSATLFDSSGTLVYAPMNLLLQSEDFTTTWVTGRSNISPDVAIAPDGATTADALIEDNTAANTHNVGQGFSFTAGLTYTISVFAKATASPRFLQIIFPSGAFGATRRPVFDLVNGTAAAATDTTASIENIGDGWYRCIASMQAASTNSASLQFQLAETYTNSNSLYDGDDTSGIYIWGAQLNLANMQGGVTADLSTYYPTTTAAYQGPRLDYDPATLAARGLLIEEQRTNLVLQSEDFATSWTTSASPTITTNTSVAPNGTTTADTIAATATSSYVAQIITFTGDGTKAYSFFIKAGTSGNTRVFIRDTTASVSRGQVDIVWTGGVPSPTVTNGSLQSLQACPNGWYRVSVIANSVVAANTNQFRIQPDNVSGTGSIIIWGFQAENGAFSTSYIPTTTTALTRSADVAAVNTLSPWFNATEGTLFVQAQDMSDAAHASAQPRAASLNDGTTSNRIDISRLPASAQARAAVFSGGASQFNSLNTAWPLSTQAKIALAYKAADFAACLGGGTVASVASGTVPTVSALTIGNVTTGGSSQWVGWIQRLTYYPRKLSSAELQAITA